MSRRAHYTRSGILAALREASVETGDTLYVTTGLGMLGILEGAASFDDICEATLWALQEAVGPEGTIIVPTYSYSFGGSLASELAVFDPGCTPSKVGPFTEYLRQQPGARRSSDPMMSMAGIGPSCEILFASPAPTSYGADSIYERMLSLPRMKCVNIGLGPNWTAFIHYADWMAKVPFRYDKLFHGQVQKNGAPEDVWWVYAVPARISQAVADAHKAGALAEAEGIWRSAGLGRGRVYVADYARYHDFCARQMEEDKWFLASGPPCDILEEDGRRAAHPACDVQIPAQAAPQELMAAFWDESRASLSNAGERLIEAMARHHGGRLSRVVSGTNCLDWIIPEKWSCTQALIHDSSNGLEWTLGRGEIAVQLGSLPFEGKITRARLLQHALVGEHLCWNEEFNDRDWRLCLTRQQEGLLGPELDVSIASNFSMGALAYLEMREDGGHQPELLVVAYTGGRWAYSENLAAAAALLELSAAGMVAANHRLRLLFVPSTAGFAAWASGNLAEIDNGRFIGAIHLKNLAPEGRPCLHNFTGADSFGWLAQRVTAMGGAVLAQSPWFDPLAPGRNPVARRSLKSLGFPNVVLGRAMPDSGTPFPGWQTIEDRPGRIGNQGEMDRAWLQSLLA